jgi:hypothetical protein
MHKNLLAIARAVAVVGATGALLVGATHAAFTSAPVSLTNNTLASATAALQVQSTSGNFGATDAGMNFPALLPGVTSSPFTFYLNDSGSSNLDVTASIPEDLDSGSIPPGDVTLEFTNVTEGGATASYTLGQMENGNQFALPGTTPQLTPGNFDTYQVTATLAGSVTTPGTVPAFTLNFVGTQQ